MSGHKFDPNMIDTLNDHSRLTRMKPDELWDAFGLSAPHVLIDIGAGTGIFARHFASKLSGTVYACDSAPEMIAWMEEHIDAETRKRIVPTRSEESVIPLKNGIADLVYLIAVYHELHSPAALLAEAKRLLKKGGVIAVVDWKPGSTQHGPPAGERVSPEDVIDAFLRAGFSDVTQHDILESHYVITAKK